MGGSLPPQKTQDPAATQITARQIGSFSGARLSKLSVGFNLRYRWKAARKFFAAYSRKPLKSTSHGEKRPIIPLAYQITPETSFISATLFVHKTLPTRRFPS